MKLIPLNIKKGEKIMGNQKRKLLIFALAFSFLFGLTLNAFGAEFPDRPITLIIPYGAGGSTDLNSRALANAAKKYLGQPVVCENKPGATGTVGPAYVISKPPDGYTIGMITVSPVVNYYRGTVQFDPVNDLTYIMRWGGYQMGLMVRADAPWKSLKDLVEYAKKNPGKVSYGTSGAASYSHLTVEELGILTGSSWVHIPCKGDNEAAVQLLGGHLEAMSGPIQAPLVASGKLRLLATYGSVRSSLFPKAPTLQECGYNLIALPFVGIMGPKGMPPKIVAVLQDAFKKAMDDPKFKSIMNKFGMPFLYLSSKDYTKAVQQEAVRVVKLLKRLNLLKKSKK